MVWSCKRIDFIISLLSVARVCKIRRKHFWETEKKERERERGTGQEWVSLENIERERQTDTEGETEAESRTDGLRQGARARLMDREKETV